MTIRSLKLDKLFMLLTPELVIVVVVDAFTFPSEPNFVQNYLSIKSKFVVLMFIPLVTDPPP
jgi:hypothetical protein